MNYHKFSNIDFFFDRNEDAGKTNEGVITHYHNLFEIYYLIKGRTTYFIDNKAYNLLPGDLVLIPSGVIHNSRYKDDLHSRILINCSQKYIPASVRTIFPSIIYLYRNADINEEIVKILKIIENEYNNPDKMTDEILTCYSHALFFLLARNKNSCKEIKSTIAFIQRAIEYLQENFRNEISLNEVAKNLNVSVEHLSRTFKKETGCGFNNYLALLRLKESVKLLKQGEYSISEIATMCGFSDGNYFSSLFKKYHGISPKAYSKTAPPTRAQEVLPINQQV